MKLLALRCPTCAQKLTPQNPEVVVLRCPTCGTAVSIGEGGLDSTDLQFAAPAIAREQVEGWVPLWLFNGQVHIHSRQTQGGSRQAQQDSEQLWGFTRRLYIPAWNMPTGAACRLGSELVQRQPEFQPIEPPAQVDLLEAVITPEDGLKLLEFVVLNLEAAREDWLKELSFSIEASPPLLWAIPAQKAGAEWQLQPLVK